MKKLFNIVPLVLSFVFVGLFSVGSVCNVNANSLMGKAETGNPAAQAMLGYSYFLMAIMEEDNKKFEVAAGWFDKAAAKGYPEALAMLSGFHSEGEGVPKDLYKAYYLVTIALSFPDDLFIMYPKSGYQELFDELSSELSKKQKKEAEAAAEKAIDGLRKNGRKRIEWFKKSLTDCVDDIGPLEMTFLNTAIVAEELHFLKGLVKAGADINSRSSEGGSPLLMACLAELDDISSFLIMQGADHSLIDDDGFTPLIALAAQGNYDLVKLLLQKGADPNLVAQEELSALNVAMIYGHHKILNHLLENGAKDAVLSNGLDVFMTAVEKGDFESVKIFLENNTPVNGRYLDYQTTPIMLAAGKGHADMVRLMLKKGADLSLKDSDGSDTRAYALGNEHPEIIELLDAGK